LVVNAIVISFSPMGPKDLLGLIDGYRRNVQDEVAVARMRERIQHSMRNLRRSRSRVKNPSNARVFASPLTASALAFGSSGIKRFFASTPARRSSAGAGISA
jgi:hypothetical protein